VKYVWWQAAYSSTGYQNARNITTIMTVTCSCKKTHGPFLPRFVHSIPARLHFVFVYYVIMTNPLFWLIHTRTSVHPKCPSFLYNLPACACRGLHTLRPVLRISPKQLCFWPASAFLPRI
jgi:hypothetical protein